MIDDEDVARRRARVLSAVIALYYAILGLAVLAPESVYSGDIGVQFVQARALLDQRFRSLNIDYPGEFLDPHRRLFPIRPPFVFQAGDTTQSIFPTATAVLQAPAVGALGLRGMILLSVLAGWATLVSVGRLAPPSTRVVTIGAIGLASPLWFYAVSGWHHALGMAAGAAAFALAWTSHSAAAPAYAGLVLGAGAILRDEVILLAPGVAVALWFAGRGARSVALLALGASAALAAAAVVDVFWFDRPAAAHLRHAVHFLQSALQTTDAPNAELPSLAPFTLRQRHETVIQYWLFGYGNDAWLLAYTAGLGLALVIRWRFQSGAGILVWLVAVAAAAALDCVELLTAPKWLAGLQRVAPYLAFVVLPPAVAAAGAPRRATLLPRVAVLTAIAYLVLAFAGVDTTGGKGLGPRLLLPLFPILVTAAIIRIRAYLQSVSRADVWSGRIGALLVLMALATHMYGTTVAYYARNRDDAAVVRAVAGSRERIVVADDPFTAQLLFPLYYRKIILLADSREAASVLASLIETHRLPGALLVSRHPQPAIVFPGLQPAHTQQVGRMSITQWQR
ncbi:MAG TPA: hypothetical protein VE379_10170 [Vicinamibacterales bacterium]|jgi:hypothetical protein|nr:hypothetical protein [Vicinamibacterales bacterium]